MKATLRCFCATSLLLLPGITLSAADPLRYRGQPDQVFAYSVTITAEMPETIETLTGQISYRIKSPGDPMQVTYSGGLVKSEKNKPNRQPQGGPPFGPPFGPRFGGPPVPIGGPFGRSANPFKGLENTTNEIGLSARGQITTLQGSSQLPYLLGNLSLLIFEPLPEQDQTTWTVQGGVSIREGEDNSRNRFGPFFDPFNRGGDASEKTTSASETTAFTLTGEQAGVASYRKSYKLQAPANQASMNVEGAGTWAFNRTLGIPESLDFSQKVSITENNTTIVIPVTINYKRLAAEELVKLEMQRQENVQKMKAEHEKRLAEMQEAQRRAELPLEPEQKKRLIADLASADTGRIIRSLGELEQRSPKDTDSQVVAAIEPILKHENKAIQAAAERTMNKWSPAFKSKNQLAKAYQGPGFVSQPDRPVTADTRLFVGQILAVHDTGAWYPSEIREILPDGTVKVAFRGWGDNVKTVPRSVMRLAPEELEQPNLAPAELAAVRGDSLPSTRTWTDRSGKFKIEAEFVRLDKEQVVIKRTKDGREVSVPLAKLSDVDQKAARVLSAQGAPIENPFEP